MYYYKARIYSPTLGRFLQVDPIGYDDQINLYAYVENDPINKVDPRGTRSEFPRDDPDFKKKVRERVSRTSRTPQDKSVTGKVGRALAKGALALGIATAMNEEGAKRDKLRVYRIFGGAAGIKGKDDAGSGSYWTTEDPRQYSKREEIRQRFALPPRWGNAVTDVAIGEIQAGNPNITSWGTASAERQGNVVYKGGGSEMTIRNSFQNVSNIRVEKLDVED